MVGAHRCVAVLDIPRGGAIFIWGQSSIGQMVGILFVPPLAFVCAVPINKAMSKLTAALLDIKLQTPSQTPNTPAAATRETTAAQITKQQCWAEKC